MNSNYDLDYCNMKALFGFLTVIISVFGGFTLAEGKLLALWQPVEIIIICGAAFGAFIIANPSHVIKRSFAKFFKLFGKDTATKESYLQLLEILLAIGMKIRKEGLLSIEAEIESPEGSPLLNRYPELFKGNRILYFLTDNLRFVVGGQFSHTELEALLDHEIEIIEQDLNQSSDAITTTAEALPGFGIVAAVLGIVITMQYIGGDPKTLGIKVAAALVGTFLGVFFAYGFVGPTATAMRHRFNSELQYYECIKMFLLSVVSGSNPALAVELARQVLFDNIKPSFDEVDNLIRSSRG